MVGICLAWSVRISSKQFLGEDMIVGNGLLASAIEHKNLDRSNTVFFASGVSNSSETRDAEFLREKELLKQVIESNHDKILIYFSSCSVYDKVISPYASHKFNMESIVQDSCDRYYIFRLPQVVGHIGNPNTVFNFLCDKIKKQESFDVWEKVYRNFIDVDNVVDIVGDIMDVGEDGKILNIASPFNVSIEFFVNQIEKHTGIKAIYEIKNKGSRYTIDVEAISKFVDIDEYFSSSVEKHIRSLLMKYC